MSVIELNNIEDHIDGAKEQLKYALHIQTHIQWILNDGGESSESELADSMKLLFTKLNLLKLHLNAIQKDENEA